MPKEIIIEKATREAERLAWIAEHGSNYLRRATKLGYNCQRQYVTERAALEFPGYQVDFANKADWQNRRCPSPEALDQVEALIEAGYDVEAIWLTKPVARDEINYAPFGYTLDDDPCEAIAINNYLGKYILVKIIE